MAEKTIAELMVKIGADPKDFEQGVQEMQDDLKGLGGDMKTIADSMGESASGMREEWRHMSEEMKNAYREAAKEMEPFKQKQQEIEFGFFKMAQGMDTYKGSTSDFMTQLKQMGAEHKKLTDQMLQNDGLARASMLENVATIMNMSGQSEKIAANYDRMRNPIYQVNNGLLQMTSRLEASARAGKASVLALSMLGPTANMKQLSDMTKMINQGLVRQQYVMMAAAVASYFLYGALHQAAMQNEAYKTSLETMLATLRQAFQPMVDVFTILMIHVYNFITLIGQMIIKFNEAHPVLAMVIQGFLMLLPALFLLLSPLAIGIGLINGMAASFTALWAVIGPLITGLAAMAGTVAIVAAVIVGVGAALYLLWTKTTWFKEAVLQAWEAIKAGTQAAWQAILTFIQPALDAIKTYIQQKITEIKQFWDENGQQILEAARNVWDFISNVIKTAMTVIGAIMVAVWPVVKSIIISTWQAIQNTIDGAIKVITGIIKLFATVLTGDWKGAWEAVKQIVTGALQLIWGLINLWVIGKFIGGFKTFATAAKSIFTSAWTGIKSIFTTSLNAIKSTITSAMNGIKTFLNTIWNGIRTAITTVLNGIKLGVQTAFNAIKSVVSSTMNAIKSALVNGFNAAKSAVSSAINGIKNTIQNGLKSALNFVKGLGASFKAAGRGLIDMMAAGIMSAIGKVTSAISKVASAARDFLPFSPAKEGPLSDLDHLDFGGPITDSITKGIPKVQEMLTGMLTLPTISAGTVSGTISQSQSPIGGVQNHFSIGQLVVREEADIKKIASELYGMQQRSLRGRGVRI